jgi:prolyl-tRNA synthetase
MGSYGIGSGRLLACIAEEHHDDHGLAWPISVAPYQVHLVMLPGKKGGETVITFAEKLYNELQGCGIEVLFDDRLESPGIKFNDADLIGLPIRLTIGERSLSAQEIELKRRNDTEKRSIPFDFIIQETQKEIVSLFEEINSRVVSVPFK